MNTEIRNGNRIARIAQNVNAGETRYILCCFVCADGEDVAVRSKTYRTFKGAEKAAHAWVR